MPSGICINADIRGSELSFGVVLGLQFSFGIFEDLCCLLIRICLDQVLLIGEVLFQYLVLLLQSVKGTSH